MQITDTKSLWKTYLIKSLCFSYILSFGFQALIKSSLIQLPEYIFVLLVICCLVVGINFLPKKLNRTDVFLLVFITILTFSNLIIHSKNGLIQCLIQGYLLVVFFVFRHFFMLWKQEMITLISKAFICMGVLASLCGITGVLINWAVVETNLVDVYYNFPYFGDKVRALGYTSSPAMLIELIGIAFVFLCSKVLVQKKMNPTDFLISIVLAVGAFFTYSKDIVLLVLAILFLIDLHLRFSKIVKTIVMIGASLLIIAYVFFTHIIVLNPNQKNELNQLSKSEFSTGKILYEDKKIILAESSYLALKKASFTMGKENLLTGVGSGNFDNKLLEMQQKGQYAPNLFIYDPHSSYLGVFAENGLIALIALLLMLVVLVSQLVQNVNSFIYYGASAIFIFLLICWLNAFSCDILNYRHLWVLLGIASGIFANTKAATKALV